METLLYNVYTDGNGFIIYRNADREVHRTDGPAIERADGYKAWYQNDKLHRTDGPAEIWSNGTKEWWVNGIRHRTNGPAVEYVSGSKEWWVNDELHRIDGPAIEEADGSKSWWIDGIRLTKEEFLKRTTVQEFSMDEIAKRLGIPVELLKIKK